MTSCDSPSPVADEYQFKKTLFEFWDSSEEYRESAERLQLAESVHRQRLPHILSGCRNVLDLACGAGDNLPYLPENTTYTGCDCSREARDRLLRRNDHHVQDVTVHLCDIERLPVEDCSQDAIISSFSFEHFVNVPQILLECDRVLKVGGLLVIFGPDFTFPNNFGPPQHAQLHHHRIRLYLYALRRVLRRTRAGIWPSGALFEYIEPLTVDRDSYLPDHDMTHLTSHRTIAQFLAPLGYQITEIVPEHSGPVSLTRRLLARLGLWGNNGDTRLVLRKKSTRAERSIPRSRELLIHRQ